MVSKTSVPIFQKMGDCLWSQSRFRGASPNIVYSSQHRCKIVEPRSITCPVPAVWTFIHNDAAVWRSEQNTRREKRCVAINQGWCRHPAIKSDRSNVSSRRVQCGRWNRFYVAGRTRRGKVPWLQLKIAGARARHPSHLQFTALLPATSHQRPCTTHRLFRKIRE